jgi:predicted lipoprotein with Yx(FWY)xxD motif
MFNRFLFAFTLILALAASGAAAQEATTVETMDDPELGTYLVDPEGMTLYIFLNDEPGSGESACYDQCEENWPVFSADEPLTLPDSVPGELGTIERTDGTTQVTYNGWPLYFWVADQEPGDVTGQGVGDVWFVAVPTEGDAIPGADVPEASPMASPEATPVAGDGTTVLTEDNADLGTIFTDAEGMTLYIFLNDEPGSGESACYDQCEENWPVFSADEPLTLPDGVPGELGTIERTDGTTQVTYNGWPLYYWAADQAPGDATGQGVGDVWYVAIPAEGDDVPGADVPES